MNVFLRTIISPIDDFMLQIRNGNHNEIGQDTLIGLKNNLPEKNEVISSNLNQCFDFDCTIFLIDRKNKIIVCE